MCRRRALTSSSRRRARGSCRRSRIGWRRTTSSRAPTTGSEPGSSGRRGSRSATSRRISSPSPSRLAAATLERLVVSLDDGDIRAVRLGLATLEAPTLIVWGTGDVYFDKTTANELLERIGGARELVELDGAKLFFPDERPDELVPLLRRHWRSA
jgi:pimeloyl-ACP methyl ester carboxylesterase